MLVRLIVAATLLSSSVFSAETNLLTVQDLVAQCKSDDVRFRISCVSYVHGVSDMMGIAAAVRKSVPEATAIVLDPVSVCGVGPVTAADTMQLFINWAEKNPKESQSEASIGVWTSIREAWPCQSK